MLLLNSYTAYFLTERSIAIFIQTMGKRFPFAIKQ